MANISDNDICQMTNQLKKQDPVLERQKEQLSIIEARIRSLVAHNSSWKINNGKSEFDVPVEIQCTAEHGRYMVAARDIQAGEVIFQEPPVVITTKAGAGPTCLNCLKPLPEEFSGCQACGAPLCTNSCDGRWHTSKECCSLSVLFLKEPHKCTFIQCDSNQNCSFSENLNSVENDNDKKFTQSDDESGVSILKIVKLLNTILTPLRTLLLMEESSELSNIIASLQSHSETRSKLPIGQFYETQILGPLRDCMKENITPTLLHFICGIFDTSAFNITLSHGGCGRAIMPLAAMMNHSCMANTERYFHDGLLVIRATLDIKKGEPITNPYTHTILGNNIRQTYLYKTKLFRCMCPRCSDPQELGSNASSIICRRCGQGLVHPPKGKTDNWKCDNCQEILPEQIVKMTFKMANALLTASQDSIASMKQALKKLCQILGKQHYITMELKMALVDAIIQHKSECIDCEDLEEVLQLTNDLLEYIGCVRPGSTRFRGLMLLRQLQASVEILKKQKSEDIDVDKKYSVVSFESLKILLEECNDILQYDTLKSQVLELKEVINLL